MGVDEASVSRGPGIMNAVEERAFKAWIAEGESMHEHVAIIVDGEWWYVLENEAEPNPDGRGEFYVDGEQLVAVMAVIIQEHGEEAPRTLWHTHTATVSPSEEDIAEFPDWLASQGAIYHVPTGTTTLYNSAGVIPVSSLEPAPLETSKE